MIYQELSSFPRFDKKNSYLGYSRDSFTLKNGLLRFEFVVECVIKSILWCSKSGKKTRNRDY